MTYNACVEMGSSQSLLQRVAACAAEHGNINPQQWAASNLLGISSASDWTSAWDSAQANANVNVNPDTGKRDDVITDEMILTAIQTLKKEQGPGVQGWPA